MTTSFETKIESAVETINYWYDLLGKAIDADDDIAADDFGTKYENAIEYYARKLHISEAKLEDIATNVRYFGWDYD